MFRDVGGEGFRVSSGFWDGKGTLGQSVRSDVSGFLLGGPWDLVTTYNWDYNPTCNWGNPYLGGLSLGL